ncbi:hypothetical protein D3C75_1135560 [compost metagenome]
MHICGHAAKPAFFVYAFFQMVILWSEDYTGKVAPFYATEQNFPYCTGSAPYRSAAG